jgi:glycerophosphoryl diester phosphodiesterase
MTTNQARTCVAVSLGLMGCLLAAVIHADDREGRGRHNDENIQVGPRPYYLISKMRLSPLKRQLEECAEGPFFKTDFSIGHRGGGYLTVS